MLGGSNKTSGTVSLANRVAIRSGLIALLGLSVVSTIGFYLLANATQESTRDTIRSRMSQVAAALVNEDNPLRYDEQSSVRQAFPDGIEVWVLTPTTDIPELDGIRVVQAWDLGGLEITLVGRQSTSQLDSTLALVRWSLFAAVIALSSVMAYVARNAVSRALTPVIDVTERTRSVTLAEIGNDTMPLIPLPNDQDEIYELVETVNNMLTRLNNSKRRERTFVSDASHELRTPLMVLQADLDHLAKNPGTASDAMADLQHQVGLLSHLTDDLLTLAVLDERESEDTTDLGSLLDAECRSAKVEVSEQQRKLEVPSTPRALRNIVANAHKYGDRVSVLVETKTIDVHDSRVVEIHVEDDGPGVPVEDRTKLFDRFARLDSDRARSSGGTGLGLSIALVEVETRCGSIHVTESTKLGGARFTIQLPVL